MRKQSATERKVILCDLNGPVDSDAIATAAAFRLNAVHWRAHPARSLFPAPAPQGLSLPVQCSRRGGGTADWCRRGLSFFAMPVRFLSRRKVVETQNRFRFTFSSSYSLSLLLTVVT